MTFTKKEIDIIWNALETTWQVYWKTRVATEEKNINKIEDLSIRMEEIRAIQKKIDEIPF